MLTAYLGKDAESTPGKDAESTLGKDAESTPGDNAHLQHAGAGSSPQPGCPSLGNIVLFVS